MKTTDCLARRHSLQHQTLETYMYIIMCHYFKLQVYLAQGEMQFLSILALNLIV